MNFWLNALASGATLTQVANAFANSTESTSLYPFLTLPNLVNAGTFVNAVYKNLLNCVPDVAGLTFWQTRLDTGAITVGNLILDGRCACDRADGLARALHERPPPSADQN
jgi:hypothetical protein